LIGCVKKRRIWLCRNLKSSTRGFENNPLRGRVKLVHKGKDEFILDQPKIYIVRKFGLDSIHPLNNKSKLSGIKMAVVACI